LIQPIDFRSTCPKFIKKGNLFALENTVDITIRYKTEYCFKTRNIVLNKGFLTKGYHVPKALSFMAPRVLETGDEDTVSEYNAPILAYQALNDLGDLSGFTKKEVKGIFHEMIERSFAPKMRLYVARACTKLFHDDSLAWGYDFLDNVSLITIST
jgi:hypothetical protein